MTTKLSQKSGSGKGKDIDMNRKQSYQLQNPDETPADIEDRLRVSYYQIISVIHSEHKVYLVRHTGNGKIFVRKDMQVYNRNIYEQLIAAPVPGIPRIYDLCEENGVLTVIEEYISGDTLEELLVRGRKFSIDEVIRIGMRLCKILSTLHSFNPPVIHRDIKPSNVMLTADGRIILLDLNASKYMNSDKAEDTRLLGTKGFAAPEQYGFGSSDMRTDLYALGMLLRTLYVPDEINSPKEKRLIKIIQTCTQLDPADRYKSAQVVDKELGSLLPTSGQNHYYVKAIAQSPLSRFFPPGFRSGRPLNMVVATSVYGVIILFCALPSQSGLTLFQSIIAGLALFLTFLALILFACNYLDVHSKLPLCNSKKHWVRIVGIILWELIIFTAMDLLMGLVIWIAIALMS